MEVSTWEHHFSLRLGRQERATSEDSSSQIQNHQCRGENLGWLQRRARIRFNVKAVEPNRTVWWSWVGK
ncbi:unnamed protein product [Sphenostylis stenocarpa]|uniref:Uncharacterized protein n=1 Tax=Sphenostylis stenocarpa TaxID=92480 RepID=A0AA86VA89_9FABA|nr:unnamed protein product [Sphenostylis stenocarpa]